MRLKACSGLAVVAGLTLGLGGRAALAETYTLSVTGDPGARVAGACTLLTGSAEEQIELVGPVPLERRFTGEGLSCRLEAAGRVVVEIAGPGSRSRSATTGGTITVTLR